MKIDTYSRSEWDWMRRLFALLWFGWIPVILLNYDTVTEPTGVAHFINLNFLSGPVGCPVIIILSLFFAVLYASGRKPVFSILGMFIIGMLTHTFMDANGSYHHTELIQLALAGQLIAYLQMRWQSGTSTTDVITFNRAIFYSKQLIMATYFVSAISKLLASGLLWANDAPFMSVQIMKGFHELHYSFNLPWLSEYAVLVSEFVISWPWLIKLLFGTALCFEFFGFLATPYKKASFWVGLFFILFHLSTFVMLGVFFPHYFFMLLIFMVNIGSVFSYAKKQPAV